MTRPCAPELAIVVDTEEEFDWTKPFSRDARAVTAIPAQARAQEIYARFGLVPTYVVDHPVATDPVAAGFLRSLKDAGAAEIGAHLHPWVTPPHDEAVNVYNSYHCNLAAGARARQARRAHRCDRGRVRRAPHDLQGRPLRLWAEHPARARRAWLRGRLQLWCRTPICRATAAPISAAARTRLTGWTSAPGCSKCR